MTEHQTDLIILIGDIVQCLMAEELQLLTEQTTIANLYELNWDWTISDKSTLSTVAYMSNGRGGGLGDIGKVERKKETG